MKVKVAEIQVGLRAREDLGDLDELAASIKRYGLLQPVVVDAVGVLVAGSRRLQACQQLGHSEIEVRQYGELTDLERLEIELEENLRRKDLSAVERSRAMLRRDEIAEAVVEAEAAAETEAKAEAEIGSADASMVEGTDEEGNPRIFAAESAAKMSRSNGRGRPKQLVTRPMVSQRTGDDPRRVREAREHVRYVERYPELEELSQAEALEAGKLLDGLTRTVVAGVRKLLPPRLVAHEAVKRIQHAIRRVERELQAESNEAAERLTHQSESVTRARVKQRWSRPASAMVDMVALDPREVAAALNDEERRRARLLATNVRDWLERLEEAMDAPMRAVS